MKMKKKIEIILSPSDLEEIIIYHLKNTRYVNENIGSFSFDFKVVNSSAPSNVYIQDTMDNYVFDGITIVATETNQ